MDVKRYIDSGILEAFVTGATSPAEEQEVLFLKNQYPEIREALQLLEIDMEHLAKTMAVPPPPATWMRIEADINGLIERDVQMRKLRDNERTYTVPPQPQTGYIDVEAESSHMRIHKNWKWVFAAVFVLGKIFLACAIYFYLENRQAQEQIRDLKQELQEQRR